MRKLFILLLLVSIVPFTVGCNGLFDNSSDGSGAYYPPTTLASTIAFSTTVTVPASTSKTSIRAAVTAPTMTIGGVIITGTTKDATHVVFAHNFTKTELGLTTTDTYKALPFTLSITVGGVRQTFSSSVNLYVRTSSDTEATNEIPMSIASGELTVTGNPTPIAKTDVLSQLDTVKVGEKELGQNTEDGLQTIDTLTPTFTVNFTGSTPAPASLTVIVTRVINGNNTDPSYSFTGDNNLYTNSVKTSAHTAEITPNYENHTLTPNSTYKVEVKSANSQYQDYDLESNSNESLAIEDVTVYFKTPQATLKTVTVNDKVLADFTGTTKDVPVVQDTTTVKLAFDYKIKHVPTNGTLKITDSGVTYTSANTAHMEVVDGCLVVTFSKALTKGKTYTVSFDNSATTWNEADTSTPATITFTTAAQ